MLSHWRHLLPMPGGAWHQGPIGGWEGQLLSHLLEVVVGSMQASRRNDLEVCAGKGDNEKQQTHLPPLYLCPRNGLLALG